MCIFTVTIFSKMKNVPKTINTHKHKQLEKVKIQIQEVCNKCKQKASNNIYDTQ